MPKLSSKEINRRKKISASLKKYHQLQRDLYDDFEKIIARENKTTSKTTTKSKPRTTKSRTTKTRKKSATSTKNYKSTRTRKKVKTFPSKYDKSIFFYADKLFLELNKELNIRDPKDLEKMKKEINSMESELFNFYSKSKGKKRKKKMNLGYAIKLIFYGTGENKKLPPSKVKNKTVIETTSFLKSFIVSKRENITMNLKLITEDIISRFQEYLNKQAFGRLTLKGLEAEMEN